MTAAPLPRRTSPRPRSHLTILRSTRTTVRLERTATELLNGRKVEPALRIQHRVVEVQVLALGQGGVGNRARVRLIEPVALVVVDYRFDAVVVVLEGLLEVLDVVLEVVEVVVLEGKRALDDVAGPVGPVCKADAALQNGDEVVSDMMCQGCNVYSGAARMVARPIFSLGKVLFCCATHIVTPYASAAQDATDAFVDGESSTANTRDVTLRQS